MLQKLGLRRIVKTVERSLKKRGVVGSVVHVGTAVADRVRRRGEASSTKAADNQHDAEVDRDFDTKYGVDTGGQIPQTELDVAEKNWIHGSAYIPTSPVDMGKVLEGTDVKFEETTFIDLGSGKGRVLLMASMLPFKRVVGVEFSPSLADISRDNIRRFTGPKACKDISVETNDATKFVLPDGPLVLFMYHPFDEKIMAEVERNVARSLQEKPRRILVIYWKPVHREVWDGSSSFTKRREEGMCVIYEPVKAATVA
jgi:SAM-dependent methyltransferase